MSDGFETLIPQARSFLADLARNNDRNWFKAHKDHYDARLKTPALLLLDQVAHDLSKQFGSDVDTKLFRPQRDVRFSKDKTPYTTHLHMLWTRRRGGSQDMRYFFGISPDYVTVGAGLMAFDKSVLSQWRTAVDGVFGDEIKALTATVERHGGRLREPALKRVPAPYGKDHRNGDLLRRKGFSVWRDMDPGDHGDPIAGLHKGFDLFAPLISKLETVL